MAVIKNMEHQALANMFIQKSRHPKCPNEDRCAAYIAHKRIAKGSSKFRSIEGNSSFTHWGEDQPDNYKNNEDCAEIRAFDGGKWNDVNCASKQNVLCDFSDAAKFMAVMERFTFDEAKRKCEEGGGKMAVIRDKEQQAFATMLIQSLRRSQCDKLPKCWAYIAHKRIAKGSRNFRSIDGSSNFTLWGEDQPDNDKNNEDCVEIHATDGKWNDLNCASRQNVLCDFSDAAAFVMVIGRFTFDEGKLKCKEGGGKMAVIKNMEHQALATMLIQKSHHPACPDTDGCRAYIAHKRIAKGSRKFLSIDGSSNFTLWGEDQPDNNKNKEDCAEIGPFDGGLWNDVNCARKQNVLCDFSDAACRRK